MELTMEFTMELWMVILGALICLIVGGSLGAYIGSRRKKDDVTDFESSDTDEDCESSDTDEDSKQTVQVCAADGKVIKEYSGCCGVEGDEYSVVFDDEKGRSHEIFYSAGMVFVDEE